MKKKLLSLLLSFLIGLFLFLVLLITISAQNSQAQELGWINKIEGKGQVFFQDIKKAELNMEILKGDDLTTKNGKVEVDLGNYNYLWLDKNSRINFTTTDDQLLLIVWKGAICINIAEEPINVQTPFQDIRVIEKGFYEIEVKNDKLKIKENPRPTNPFLTWSCKRKDNLRKLEERISSYYGKISVIAKEEEKLTEIKKKIKAISTNECFAKYFSILNAEDNSSMYHITISLYPLFEPRSYDQIQTWTDAVCKSSKRILDNYCLVRNISVWAIRPILISVAGNGGLIVYGRTLYEHHTDRYEFKSWKVLKQ